MDVKPLTDFCAARFDRREHACFGISPFNSYFSEARIEALAQWGLREFESIHFFVPDVPAAFTLEALGYTPDKAVWKARRQGQYTINKIHRVLQNLSVSLPNCWNMVLDWNRLTESGRYRDLYQQVQDLYASDENFKTACLDASHWVLEKQREVTEAMLHSAVRYFLAEIPLFADTAAIVGVSNSAFCYHQSIPFIERLYRRELPLRPSDAQGYFIVREKEASQAESSLGLLNSVANAGADRLI